jgi:hypothetical protein
MGTFPPIHFVMEPDAVSKTVFGKKKDWLIMSTFFHNIIIMAIPL